MAAKACLWSAGFYLILLGVVSSRPGQAQPNSIELKSPGGSQPYIGRLLLQRLLGAARERGIKRIRCYVLAENARMRKLAEGVLGKAASLRREAEILISDFSIPESATTASTGVEALFHLLRLVARGSVLIPGDVNVRHD